MKKWLVIFVLLLLPGLAALAQSEEQPAPQEGKIQERMREYIENKLGLSRNESEKFAPIFVRYIREFAQTARMFSTDKLLRQQKIIELRLRYRTEFRQIMDEPRASRVYKIEDEFRQRARDILMENKLHDRPFRRNRSMIEIQ
jgi:hypothetical protein